MALSIDSNEATNRCSVRRSRDVTTTRRAAVSPCYLAVNLLTRGSHCHHTTDNHRPYNTEIIARYIDTVARSCGQRVRRASSAHVYDFYVNVRQSLYKSHAAVGSTAQEHHQTALLQRASTNDVWPQAWFYDETGGKCPQPRPCPNVTWNTFTNSKALAYRCKKERSAASGPYPAGGALPPDPLVAGRGQPSPYPTLLGAEARFSRLQRSLLPHVPGIFFSRAVTVWPTVFVHKYRWLAHST